MQTTAYQSIQEPCFHFLCGSTVILVRLYVSLPQGAAVSLSVRQKKETGMVSATPLNNLHHPLFFEVNS